MGEERPPQAIAETRGATERAERIVRTAEVAVDDADPIGTLSVRLGSGLSQVFLFADSNADFAALVEAAQGRFGTADIVACTTAGELGSGGYAEGSIVAMGLPESHFATRTMLVEDLTDLDGDTLIGDVIRARLALDKAALQFEHAFGFLVVDGLSMREDQLMSAIASGMGAVPVFGGSAGDGDRFETSLVAIGGKTYSNAAVLTLVRSRCRVEVFSLDHFEASTDRMVVTRADSSQRIVREINAEPAAREYARILGKNPDYLSPFIFAAHPLVVRVGGRHHVRAIQRVTESGELKFFCAIDEGIVLSLARAGDMAAHLETELGRLAGQGEMDTVLACDCVLRRIEAAQTQKSHQISATLARHNVRGFNTYGEQLGAKHVNQTMTGVAIYRPDEP